MGFWGKLFPFNMCSNAREGHASSSSSQRDGKSTTQTQASSTAGENPFADVPDSDEVVTYRLNMR
eukprot:6423751-Pyramimonas_sp.AAC.1